jgi:hypothetical protein
MTQQQSIDDIMAALTHHLRQLERDARSWEHQAHDWRAVADRQRGELAQLLLARSAADQEVGRLTGARDELMRQLAETHQALSIAEQEREAARTEAAAAYAAHRMAEARIVALMREQRAAVLDAAREGNDGA